MEMACVLTGCVDWNGDGMVRVAQQAVQRQEQGRGRRQATFEA